MTPTCPTCEHLTETERTDIHPPVKAYWCDYFALDTNLPGKWIGFLPVTPEWCPMKPPETEPSGESPFPDDGG